MPKPRGKSRRRPTSGYSSSTSDDRPFNRPSLEEQRRNQGLKTLSTMKSPVYRPRPTPVYQIPSGTGPFKRNAKLSPGRVIRAWSPATRTRVRSRTARRK